MTDGHHRHHVHVQSLGLTFKLLLYFKNRWSRKLNTEMLERNYYLMV